MHFIFVQFMQFPVLDFGLDHYVSEPSYIPIPFQLVLHSNLASIHHQNYYIIHSHRCAVFNDSHYIVTLLGDGGGCDLLQVLHAPLLQEFENGTGLAADADVRHQSQVLHQPHGMPLGEREREREGGGQVASES